MHILIIPSELYVPKESPMSGIFQQDQARALNRAGYKVGVISPCLRSLKLLKKYILRRPNNIEYENDDGILIIRYHGWSIPHQIYPLHIAQRVKVGLQLFDNYIKWNGMPDLIHSHNVLHAGIISYEIKNKFGIPYVLTEHSTLYATSRIHRKALQAMSAALKNANRTIVVSPQLGNLLEKTFGDAVRLWEWVPNILDIIFEKENLIEIYKEESQKDEHFKFFNVAGLIERKGQKDLINAFANHLRGKEKIQLRIGGAGPIFDELKTLVEDLGISSQVVFLGYLNRDRVLKEMLSSDVFVLPSHYETFGVVVIEALACGKPVIATNCGGPEYIINERNGILVPPKDVDSLGDAMSKMMKNLNRYDSSHIRKDCLLKYGEKKIVEKLTEIYSAEIDK